MSEETTTAPSRKANDGFLSKIKLPLTFALVTLLAVGIYYYFFVQKKYTYMTGRDFRFLAAIGTQFKSALENRGRMLKNLEDKSKLGRAALESKLNDPKETRGLISDYLPGFDDLDYIKDKPAEETAFRSPVPALRTGTEEPWVDIYYTLGGTQSGVLLRGSLKLSTLAQSLFRPRKAFDVVLLADESGKVVYHQGSEDLSVTRLNLLLDKSLAHRTRGKETRSIGALLHGSSESYSVELNGREYRLFVEPVHLPLGVRTHRADALEINRDKVWLICGLVSQKEFVYKSLAVSSVLLSSLLGLLVLAALTWPFLKLLLIGETQRISVLDLLLLCICTVLGLSITTLALLDARSFTALKSTAKYQLQDIGNQMQRNVSDEIRAAYSVMDKLEEVTTGKEPVPEEGILAKYKEAFKPYPVAQTFSLINKEGMQTYKGSINSKTPFQVNVYDRDYFKRVVSGNTWNLRDLGDGETSLRTSAKTGLPQSFYLQPIWGWTSGTRFVVMSKPADVASAKVDEDDKKAPKVATLSIPMLSLVDPVLPPGFKFAVIDNEEEIGLVRFHSDPERNLIENFLTEADQDRKLRSAVYARRAETMKIRYWGEDYLVHVTPVTGLPWTIVALRDLKTLRAVNVATISTTLLLILCYTGVLALILVIGAYRRSNRAEWLWPDPQRRSDYNRLNLAYLLILCAFLIAVWGIQGSTQLIAISLAFPVLAFLMAYMTLTKKRASQEAALGLSVVLAVALLLTVSRAPFETMLYPVLPRIIGILLLTGLLTTSGRQVLDRWRSNAESKDANNSAPRALIANHMALDWKSVAVPYRFVAGLLLLLIAVLPTVGFFKVSHHAHSTSMVRHGQLSLSMALKERALRGEQAASGVSAADRDCWRERRLSFQHSPLSAACKSKEFSKLKGLDIYAPAFYGTRIEIPMAVDRVAEVTAPWRPSSSKDCECTAQAGEVLPEFLVDLLPSSSDATTEMRGLLYPNASDCTWHWKEDMENPLASYVFHNKDYPRGEIHLISALRQPVPRAPGASAQTQQDKTVIRASFGGAPTGSQLYGFLSLILLFGLIAAVVAFIARRIFLINLLAPLWSEKDDTELATIGRNLFLVGKPRNWSDEVKQSFFCIHIKDLDDPEKGWPARRADLLDSKQMILVEGFEVRLRDAAWNQKKLELLEELVGMQERTVVVTSMVNPAMLFSRETSKGNGVGILPLEQRWRNLLSFFTIVEGDLEIQQRIEASAKIKSPVLRAESGADSNLLPIAEQLDKHVDCFSDEQILEEFGERAEGYYHALWSSCSSEEQVVLEHLAEEGLVNEKSRRVIRRLMARGFIRRDPNFRLMNESFRRFVASSICRSEVLYIEKQAAPSAWDRLRLPLFAGLAGSIGFLLATQQELLDGLIASITGLTAGIPAIAKLFQRSHGTAPRS